MYMDCTGRVSATVNLYRNQQRIDDCGRLLSVRTKETRVNNAWKSGEPTRLQLAMRRQLKNRKHFPPSYHVTEWKFGRTRNWEYQPHVNILVTFPAFSSIVLSNFQEYFYNSIETWNFFSIFLQSAATKKKGKYLFYLHDHQNINSLLFSLTVITSTASARFVILLHRKARFYVYLALKHMRMIYLWA